MEKTQFLYSNILHFQPGFGWTNGVALDLLVTYGDRLQARTSPTSDTGPSQREPRHDPSSGSDGCFTTLVMSTVISSLIYVHIL